MVQNFHTHPKTKPPSACQTLLRLQFFLLFSSSSSSSLSFSFFSLSFSHLVFLPPPPHFPSSLGFCLKSCRTLKLRQLDPTNAIIVLAHSPKCGNHGESNPGSPFSGLLCKHAYSVTFLASENMILIAPSS